MRFPTRQLIALLPLLAGSLEAQSIVASQTPSASISGTVVDSVGRRPLANAIVQLVAADDPSRFERSTTSDSLGRFFLAGIPNGSYALGFFHPLLDSLGLEAPLRQVQVAGQAVQADLAIPSPGRLRAAICGGGHSNESDAVIVGIVRNSRDGSPIAGATVIGEWVEISVERRRGMIQRIPRLEATTASNGWFALCNVPSAGAVSMSAISGADSTDVIEVDMSQSFARRELFLGEARLAMVADTSRRSASAPRARPVRTGDVTLTGSVVAMGGRPIAGALVSIPDGVETTTDQFGEWTLTNAPGGTRVLEVRALGFYPDRRHVDVVDGAPPVRVALSTLQAVLDTVKVRASRLRLDQERIDFESRRHQGPGRYFTQADIARRTSTNISAFLTTISGLRVGFATDTLFSDMVLNIDANSLSTTDRRILMRGTTGNWCAPAIYLDGIFMPGIDADAVDSWLIPRDIAGIEIYSEATAPPRFQVGRTSCGSIVIWRK